MNQRSGESRKGAAAFTAGLDRLAGHLLFLRIAPPRWNAARRDEFWAYLNAWLLSRGLYLGGDSSAAAIYSPQNAGMPPNRIVRLVRRKLDRELEGGYRLDTAVAAPKTDRRWAWAVLEAVRGAQSALSETAGLCGEDLDKLLTNLRRRG